MTRWLCCYDVKNNRRRARLHRRLQGFLRPVQMSVFEGHLNAEDRRRLEAMVLRTIDPRQDTVRLYPLCTGCSQRMRLLGSSAPIDPPDEPLFF